MNILKTILATIVALLIMSACHEHKKYQDELSQQQEFPERIVSTQHDNGPDCYDETVDTTIEQQTVDNNSLIKEGNDKDKEKLVSNHKSSTTSGKQEAKSIYKTKKSHSSYNDAPYAERKTADELEVEYHDVFGDSFLDHIDDEEYDAAEEYDYEDHWQKMPQEIVQQRPVMPHGKFHKFNPKDL